MSELETLLKYLDDPHWVELYEREMVHRAYVEGEGVVQMVHTPWALCKNIVDKLKTFTCLEGKSVLVLNVEFLPYVQDAAEVWFVADNKEKGIIANVMYPKCKIMSGCLLNLTEGLKMAGRKFDVVIGNPPYFGKGKGLHLRFLETAFELTQDDGYVLFVHPATWLISNKVDGTATKYYKQIKQLVAKSVLDFTFLNPDVLFGVEMSMPIVITFLRKNNGNVKYRVIDKIKNEVWDYDDIDDINIFCNYPEYFSLKGKFLQAANKDCLDTHVDSDGRFYVILPKITGHLDKKSLFRNDFFTLCNRTTVVSKQKDKSGLVFGFQTQKEAENFLAYVQSKVARFALAIYKFNKNIHMGELRSVPWLDFSQEYTDNRLRKEFNITDQEWKFIDSVIPDYYGENTT